MSEAARPLVVRAPNHLGDLVMALPALRSAEPDAIVVARTLTPLLGIADVTGDIIPLDRGAAAMLAAARRIRRGRYARGILLTPSFSSALLFRLARVVHIRGSGTDRREVLLDDVVPRVEIDAGHRIVAYCLLATGSAPAERPAPVLHVPEHDLERWRELLGPADGPTVGVFPGSNAPSRRWAPGRFAEVVRGLAGEGLRVVVFGGPSERALSAAVAGDAAFDAAGRTDLPLLAAGLASCDILITNDSGPMHLAVAVGTPTLSLQGPANVASTGPTGPRHRILRRDDLPCVPCVKNSCPRHGAGFILPEAERECLNLITAAEVLAETRVMLAAS